MSKKGGDALSWLVIKDGDIFIRAAGGEERPRRIYLDLPTAPASANHMKEKKRISSTYIYVVTTEANLAMKQSNLFILKE